VMPMPSSRARFSSVVRRESKTRWAGVDYLGLSPRL
jgi:hypothetical protein